MSAPRTTIARIVRALGITGAATWADILTAIETVADDLATSSPKDHRLLNMIAAVVRQHA